MNVLQRRLSAFSLLLFHFKYHVDEELSYASSSSRYIRVDGLYLAMERKGSTEFGFSDPIVSTVGFVCFSSFLSIFLLLVSLLLVSLVFVLHVVLKS